MSSDSDSPLTPSALTQFHNEDEVVKDVVEAEAFKAPRSEVWPTFHALADSDRATCVSVGEDSVSAQTSEARGEEQSRDAQVALTRLSIDLKRLEEAAYPVQDGHSKGSEEYHLLFDDDTGLAQVQDGTSDGEEGTDGQECVKGEIETGLPPEHVQEETNLKKFDGLDETNGQSKQQETDDVGDGPSNEARQESSEGKCVSMVDEEENGNEDDNSTFHCYHLENVEQSKNSSYDSGVSRSKDASFVETQQKDRSDVDEKKSYEESNLKSEESAATPHTEDMVMENSALEVDGGLVEEQLSSHVAENLTLLVKALPGHVSPSVDAVMEDFAWFDCPGLEVTKVEEGLLVSVEDRQLGLVAMEGLKHKYSISKQVENILCIKVMSSSL